MVEKTGHNANLELTKEDYYFERGLMVFTAVYHLKRGYCCKSSCRHCPYGFNEEKDNKKE